MIKEADDLYQQKKYNRVIKKYEEANSVEKSSKAFIGIGLSYIQISENINRRTGLSYTSREMQKENNLESAICNLLKASNLEPDNAEITSYLKEAYSRYFETFNKEYSKTAKMQAAPKEGSVLKSLIDEGYSLLEQGKYNNAVKKFNKANEIEETFKAYRGLGLASIKKVDSFKQVNVITSRKFRYLKKALRYFSKASSFDPDNIEVKYYFADVFILCDYPQHYKIAELLLEQILNTDKEYKDVNLKLSYVHKQLEKSDE